MTKLVIVESPTKAKTISGYLPKDYVVMASMGHVRDLPSSAAEIPKAVRGESWARLGVDVEEGFAPLYVISPKRRDTIKKLKTALKDADELIIATDEDREGESIGWHLVEVLQPKVPVKRMVFHEITREAIERALSETRQIDDHLVRAQETRRILDRLVGYTLSPLLWKKIAPKLSAGRVQSVAVRLLVERERERHAFVKSGYWDLAASLAKQPDRPAERFGAALSHVGGKAVATGKDFDADTGQVAAGRDVLVLDEAAARALKARLEGADWAVTAVESRQATRSPSPPFTTSTLQQEAGRKLRLSARDTMRVAQSLYEQGFITYHRTDSVHLSDEAVDGARGRITDLYGKDYLSPKPRQFKTKSRNAQEAHEAIRPAGGEMKPVAELPLSGREAALYDLIWKRSMATQMAEARLEFASVTIEAADAVFRARGRRVLFPGFFRAYVEGSDDPEAAIEDQDAPLPELKQGEALSLRELEAVGHETKPPARFTEAALVKALEANGVGRPSTYASIISTIQDRGYVQKQGSALTPTFTAFAVTGLLESDFESLVNVGFTAEMEEDLDHIAEGKVDWQTYLARFFQGEKGLESLVGLAGDMVDPRSASTVALGEVRVRIGRFGPYLERGEGDARMTAALPEDLAPGDLTPELAEELLEKGQTGPEALGEDPATGQPVYLKDGPYGPYVQRGEDGTGKDRPPRVSLPKDVPAETVDLALALRLLELPRLLGEHPESGKEVRAGIGRFGPYVVHDGVFASLKKEDDVLEIDLARGLELLAAKAARGPGRGRATTANVLKALGEHPDDKEPVNILDGRYGPYVKHGKTNASLPKDADPQAYTLADALKLLSEKRGRGGPIKRSRVGE
ncbi:MAG: type I DNA topoisomerase [Caldilineae bacterium]|nr:type I DNA topoisomerase [Chloroflexota bacterium]MCB9176955.1 type I DNA topoisomerase [Caldilineae bacterium]